MQLSRDFRMQAVSECSLSYDPTTDNNAEIFYSSFRCKHLCESLRIRKRGQESKELRVVSVVVNCWVKKCRSVHFVTWTSDVSVYIAAQRPDFTANKQLE